MALAGSELDIRKIINNNITVEPGKIVGHNEYRRPNWQGGQIESFKSGAEAIAWIQENPAQNYQVNLELPFAAKAILEGEFRTPQTLTFKVGEREGKHPRNVEGMYGVSADPNTNEVYTINITIGDYDTDPIFNRGLAWIHPNGSNRPATLTFTISEGDHSPEELAAGFSRLANKVQEVLNLLLGIQAPNSLDKDQTDTKNSEIPSGE
jgi:hypothetical protein